MNIHAPNRFLPVFAAAVLLMCCAAFAGKAEVVDSAGFFSADAVMQANQKLGDLDSRFGREMRVETFPEIPNELRGQYTEAGKRAFFQKWARQRAEAAGVRGVIVLICKNPSSLQVEVGGDTARSGVFTQTDRARMSTTLVDAFKAKNFDQGLAAAVSQFESALKQRADQKPTSPSGAALPPMSSDPSASPPSSTPKPYNLPGPQSSSPQSSSAPQSSPPMGRPSSGVGFGGIIIFVLVIFVVLAIIRRILGGGRSSAQQYNRGYGPDPGTQGMPPGYGYGGGYGSGGGFGRGFGGGILGGLLGGWIGNQMSQRQDSFGSAQAAPPPSDPGGTFNEPPPTDFSSGGGDASGGGGDFGGGGIGGGGDFSGGGGGGDASSGGGDF
jgi:hypothetical protein